MNVQSLCAPWVALHENLGLGGPVRDEAHYAMLLEVAEGVADLAAADEANPLAGLLPLLADRIREYEDRMHPWPDNSTPATVLATLMQAHGLRQPIHVGHGRDLVDATRKGSGHGPHGQFGTPDEIESFAVLCGLPLP